MGTSGISSRASLHPEVRTPAPQGGVLTSHRFSDLRRITEPNVVAVVVRRAMRAQLRGLATGLPDAGFCRMIPLVHDFAAQGLLGSSFRGEAEEALAADIERLQRTLAEIAPGSGHAQLAVTAKDECRKFHVDYYRLRLLVSYVGPGTELVPEFALDRTALCSGGDEVHAANRAIAPDSGAIVRARAGDVVMLKGERSGAGLAAVHRSPPVADHGLVRLVLKMTVE